jgi:hypothetical protein
MQLDVNFIGPGPGAISRVCFQCHPPPKFVFRDETPLGRQKTLIDYLLGRIKVWRRKYYQKKGEDDA